MYIPCPGIQQMCQAIFSLYTWVALKTVTYYIAREFQQIWTSQTSQNLLERPRNCLVNIPILTVYWVVSSALLRNHSALDGKCTLFQSWLFSDFCANALYEDESSPKCLMHLLLPSSCAFIGELLSQNKADSRWISQGVEQQTLIGSIVCWVVRQHWF